jgi:hypothetical protein
VPVTLITNGYRLRLREDGERKIATLRGIKFANQEELQAAWETAVTAVPDDDFVSGAGSPGIFSEPFAQQVVQITDLRNVWCPSTGLGMVCLGAEYPQYDLEDFDAKITRALDPKMIKAQEWWKFSCDLSGNSMESIITAAIKKGHRVIIALPPLSYSVYRDDLNAMITKVGVEAVRAHVRIVGPDLESVVPPKLLPCVMPYDKEGLNTLVPGVRAHGVRRMAALLMAICKPGEDGASDPLEDYEKLADVLTGEVDCDPITYETGAEDKPAALTRLKDDDLREKVEEYAELAGAIPQRIVRMMREDGFSIKVEVAERILKELEA